MGTPTAAAIYARISLDQEGDGKAIERQLQDCTRLAKELGWPIAEEYVDSDLSGFSGKPRPAYERMLADIQAGTIDAVLIYNLDRLTRQPREFERFYDIVTAAGATNVRFVTGNMDLGTDNGLLVGRIQAAVAADQSLAKSRRVRRKLDQVAAEGRPHGGSRRPFGFEADRVTHRESEAQVIRELVDRYLAGESLLGLQRWLNDEGIPTSGGGEWRGSSLRQILTSQRNAGFRVHRGEVVGLGTWDPIITPAQLNKVLSRMADRRAAGTRTARRYLLSGLARCGVCGCVLYSAPRHGVRRYVCSSTIDHRGCGKISVVADPLEKLIADAVLYRLDTPELADALAGKAADNPDLAVLMDDVSADREQLDTLAGAYAKREITMAEWMTARKVIEERMGGTERRIRRATQTDSLAGVIGQGDALRVQWSGLTLQRQIAVVKAILDHARVDSADPAFRKFDPRRITPVWRL